MRHGRCRWVQGRVVAVLLLDGKFGTSGFRVGERGAGEAVGTVRGPSLNGGGPSAGRAEPSRLTATACPQRTYFVPQLAPHPLRGPGGGGGARPTRPTTHTSS